MKVSPRHFKLEKTHSRRNYQRIEKTNISEARNNKSSHIKVLDRNYSSERENASKSTILIQNKKTNISNITTFNETTLNSQMIREANLRESDCKSYEKQIDKGENSQEITIVEGAKINKPKVPLLELRALYQMKGRELRELKESTDELKSKISTAVEYIGKNKYLLEASHTQDQTIEILKSNLRVLHQEINHLKLAKRNNSIPNISKPSFQVNQPIRSPRSIFFKATKSTSNKPSPGKLEKKFRKFEQSAKKDTKLPLKVKSTLKPLICSPDVSCARTTRESDKIYTEGDHYLLSENHVRNLRRQNLTARNGYVLNSPLKREDSTYYRVTEPGWDTYEACSEYLDINENSVNKFYEKSVLEYSDKISPKASIFRNSSSSRKSYKSPICDGFKTLLLKFDKVLNKYNKAEDVIVKKNQILKTKIEELIKKKKQFK